MITLYDFTTLLPGKSFSSYVWRVRFALNLKSLPHQTHWLSLSTLPHSLPSLGIPPNPLGTTGTAPGYTVPAISDDSSTGSGTTVVDSLKIYEYLDATYPSTPQLCRRPTYTGVPNANELNALVDTAFDPAWDLPREMHLAVWAWIAPTVVYHGFEDDADAAKFSATSERVLGTTVEALDSMKDQSLAEAKQVFTIADTWLQRARDLHGGSWAVGDTATIADLALGSALAWVITTFGEDSNEWRMISEDWDDGRWGRRWNQFKPYSTVH